MKSKVLVLLAGLLGCLPLLQGQPVYQIDTLYSAVPQTHQYLHMRVPLGELYMRSSGECGISLARLRSPDASVQHEINQSVDHSGNHQRSVVLTCPGMTPKGGSLHSDASADRMSADFSSFSRFGRQEAFRSEFNLDPNLSTDLHLDLGVGASRLDFSGLTLRNVSIRSAMADVMINYQQPNQIEMQQMDIHVTKGDVVLKQPEMARARLISIQNDMGDTKIVLGDDYLPQSTISVHAGVGGFTLIVDKQHPTKVVIRGGLFSDQEVGGSFQAQDKQTFVNTAYRTHCQNGGKGCVHATRVICDLDLGSVSVMEME
jgi:hypothetical protein